VIANRSRYGAHDETDPSRMLDQTTRLTQPRRVRRAFWLRQLHTWHWMSSALCLIGLLLFTITGITLNHAAEIEASPVTTERQATLPAGLLSLIAPDDEPDASKPLPPVIAKWLSDELGVSAGADAEWSAEEIYLALPKPGGDGWVSIDRASGEVIHEDTSRGVISYLNDLHKGRNSGTAWKWFIDIFAGACLVFTITGLFLLQLHSAKRRSTWPIVGLGLLIPAAVAIIFIH